MTLTQTRTTIPEDARREGVLAVVIGRAVVAGSRAAAALVRAARMVQGVVTPLGWSVIVVAALALAGGYTWGWLELIALGWGLVVLVAAASVWLIGRGAGTIQLVLPSPRVVVGEPAEARLIAANPGRRRFGGVQLELPVGRRIVERVLPGLPRGGVFDEQFAIPTERRGVVPVGPARTVRADPIGLMRREFVWSETAELHVHPRTVPINALSTGFIRDLEGTPTRDLTASDIAFHALREYVPGDDRRFIHWRSSAKTGTFMVRQFEETRRSRLMVLLDLDPGSYVDAAEFELAVSAAASVGARAIRDARTVSFVVSGRQRGAGAGTGRNAMRELPTVSATGSSTRSASSRPSRKRSCSPMSPALRRRRSRACRSPSSSPVPRAAWGRSALQRPGSHRVSRASRCSARPRVRRVPARSPASPSSASATSKTCARCSRDRRRSHDTPSSGGCPQIRAHPRDRRARRRDARRGHAAVVAGLRESGVRGRRGGRDRRRSRDRRRRSTIPTSSWIIVLAVFGAYLVLGVPAAVPGAAIGGILPSPSGIVELLAGAALSWKQLVTISVPVGSYQALLVPPFLLGMVAATAAISIALRSRRPAAAALPPAALLIAGIALGVVHSALAVEAGVAFLITAVAWLVRVAIADRRAITGGRRVEAALTDARRVLGASALVAIAVVGATAASVALPVPPRNVVRAELQPPFEPRRHDSPLAGFRAAFDEDVAEDVMLDVRGLPGGAGVRMATLDSYDGIVYTVGGAEGASASGRFTRVPYRLDQSGASGETERLSIEVEVEGYSDVWVPGSVASNA